jgi:predicted ATP-binding protein involved in virulence
MNWQNAAAEYHSFFSWFREMEDLENEQSRFRDEAANPQLQSVRTAIESFFPGYSSLRIRRQFPLSSRPILTLEKGGVLLPFDSLSEGERNSIAMVADIARRLALLGSNGTATNGGAQGDPLAREGTILIDEIEQHLHPGWQRHLMRELPKTFPGLQFIVTTQSPVIVSEIGAENLRVLKDFALVESHHHHGRDANAVLEETFETSSRPDEVKADLDELATLIDDRRLEEAEALLRSLETQLGESDPDIVYYRNIFERLRPAG